MTVSALIQALQELNPDDVVVMSKDAEGNQYSVVLDIASEMRFRDGEIGFRVLTDDLKRRGYCEEDVMPDGENCIVIYPQ